MKKTILVFALAFTGAAVFAQKKTTTSATINFDATTSLDALPKAENKAAVASLDTKKGTVAFEAIIKNFSFTNPKIQEHFNGEGWMNSDKFPTATFKGTITNLADIKFDMDGTYTATVEGNLTIHGETKPTTTTAKITVKDKIISTSSDFSIKLEDYKVDGAAVGAGKVSKVPTISVVADFK